MYRPIKQSGIIGSEWPQDLRRKFGSRLLVGALAATLLFGTASTSAIADVGSFAVVSLKFETNATDGDVGVHVFFDADYLERVQIKDPAGRTVFAVKSRSSLSEIGFTELFFESVEPLIAELAPDGKQDKQDFTVAKIFELFPAGEYKFEGETVDGEELEGTAMLTKVIPSGPKIVAPPANVPAGVPLVIDWEPVTETILPDLGPLTISGYIVIVGNEDTQDEFSIDLPAGVSEVTVPAAFLAPGTEFELEVLAIEESGNQTLTETTFTTSE